MYKRQSYATAKEYFDALGAGADIYTKGAPTSSTSLDFINLSGSNSTLSVGNRSGAAWGQGAVVVNSVGTVTAPQGQVFNLIDWSGASMSGGFSVGSYNTYDASTSVIAGDLDLAALGAGLAWDVSAFTTYGVPVSYTHLDVYKRQVWHWARRQGPPRSPAGHLWNFRAASTFSVRR